MYKLKLIVGQTKQKDTIEYLFKFILLNYIQKKTIHNVTKKMIMTKR